MKVKSIIFVRFTTAESSIGFSVERVGTLKTVKGEI
jgi:hypothetical protein